MVRMHKRQQGLRGEGPRGQGLRVRSRCRCRSGFTLLELILAITVTAIISVTLFASLRIAFDVRENAEDRLAGRVAARVTLDLSALDLAAAPAPIGRIAGPFVGTNERMGISRDADTLTFITAAVALPAQSDLGDLRSIELALVDDPINTDTRMLVRYVTLNPLSTTTPEPTAQILARGVISFNARYFDGGDWRDEWDSADQENALPNAIELTLVLQPEQQDEPTDPFDEDNYITMVRLIQLPAAPEPQSTSDGGAGGLLSF